MMNRIDYPPLDSMLLRFFSIAIFPPSPVPFSIYISPPLPHTHTETQWTTQPCSTSAPDAKNEIYPPPPPFPHITYRRGYRKCNRDIEEDKDSNIVGGTMGRYCACEKQTGCFFFLGIRETKKWGIFFFWWGGRRKSGEKIDN